MSTSARFVFKNMSIVTSGVILEDMAVIICAGVIEQIVNNDEDFNDLTVVDLNGALLCPGFIDLQIYGSGKNLFGGHPSVAGLHQMESDLCTQGTTGFLATIATNSNDIMIRGIESAKLFSQQSSKGNYWGLHFEGPYLNGAKRGAHPLQFIQTASKENVTQLLDTADGAIKMMTIAAELVPSDIRALLAGRGVVLSCGHSNASFAEASTFFAPPPSHSPETQTPQPDASKVLSLIPTVTHLFNAMPALHHREPGLVAAVFEKQPFASIVADGVHVDFAMVRLAKKLLPDKLFLITDAVTESTEGTYPHKLFLPEEMAIGSIDRTHTVDRYVMPDGTLSGSALTLPLAIRNCVLHCGIPLAEAVNMASLYPAQVLGLQGQRGEIREGCVADLCVMDRDFNVLRTYIAGVCVYDANEE
jgi:N-acetylglucosamine-6-phosphate deacetylase